MFNSRKIKALEDKIAHLELVNRELAAHAELLEQELIRRDKKISLMEKAMKLDQMRRSMK